MKEDFLYQFEQVNEKLFISVLRGETEYIL